MLLQLPSRSARTSIGVPVVFAGAALQMLGLAYDVRSHAGDAHAAAHEAVFTVSNPGHVLLGVGMAAVVLGTVITLLAGRAGLGGWSLRRLAPALPAVALGMLAVAVAAFALRSGEVTLGAKEEPAAAASTTHTHAPASAPWPDGAEGALLSRQLSRARSATAKYRNIEVARADGFVPLTPDVPGLGMHMIHPARIDGVFQLEEPEILLYTWAGQGWRFLGVMYAGNKSAALMPPPEGFAGDADVWHYHTNTCALVQNLKLPMDDRLTARQCVALGGSFQPEVGPWGLHVWLGTANPDGMFAHDHPAAMGLGGLFVRGDVEDRAR
jgi:hypothetical protein